MIITHDPHLLYMCSLYHLRGASTMVDKAAEKVIIEFDNGYSIRQDADLTNKEDNITYSDYQIVNPVFPHQSRIRFISYLVWMR